MKIGFVNFTPFTYDVETPYNEPLGGSESSICYLAAALAKRGHEVSLFRRIEGNFVKLGVRHLNVNEISKTELDVLILQNTPDFGSQLRKIISTKTKLIFWSQHASNQPAVASLQDLALQEVFDKIVLISDWQARDYEVNFGINNAVILRNAISPGFENLDGQKTPWSMAYTSTPFRGLSLLPEIFSLMKEKEKRVILKIFSSMKVYQAEKDEYVGIYEELRKIEEVEYVGSLSQRDLAAQMKDIAILAYPNTFPETSCIAVMEAMAAGCQIVTSNLGALPETTAGFGRLVDITNKNQYVDDFVRELLRPIDQRKISEQVKFVNENYTWKVIALEWERMLQNCVC